ncbi:MAG: leucyl/phenylalanyl-tRNA--protein transferase [Acidimicrobiales bacterium]|nr:leucyl/phenylalanyl-tRNA--protein transferase [Acidimicrobiia bacterium]NNC80176.1 leucyl/phenylalanyl-tRNA--protein transferase [Acidimicrobiales bacterium]RZV46700.1 MAG: leucyl/phenylalanyl-tRNA--protein transferase [Acidimicrobiales bacterium]
MSEVSWVFPPASTADENGIVGVGADLSPATMLAAYSDGIFPMPLHEDGDVAWWSPDPRAIMPIEGLHVSRSLRRSMRRFTVTVDTEFEAVVDACADPGRPQGWIDQQMKDAYRRLHEAGFAHSIEVRSAAGELIGGLFGVGFDRFFAGESMFHHETDASKGALVATCDYLRNARVVLFDVQWLTPHLESMGAIEVPRTEYLRRLAEAVSTDPSGNRPEVP